MSTRYGSSHTSAGLLGVVVLLLGCAAPGSEATARAEASPPPSASTPAGSPALPDDRLALRLVESGDVSGIYPVAQLTLMADGRVIAISGEPDLGWSVRRLSPAGVEALIDLAQATGLFTASARYPMQRRPDAPDPPGHGGCDQTVVLDDGEGAVVVSGTCWFGDEYEATYNVPSPARRALSELATQLRDLSWLAPDAWDTPEPEPYVPRGYLFISTWSLGTPSGLPSLDGVTWPFGEPLEEFGTEIGGASGQMTRCAELSMDDAQAIFDQLVALTGPPGLDLAEGYFGMLGRGSDAIVDIWLQPQLPDGFPACSQLLL